MKQLMKLSRAVILSVCATALAIVCISGQLGHAETKHNWREIHKSTSVKWPKALTEVVWRDDVLAALKEAKTTDRPVFVVFRCLPCKQCSAFDARVLAGGPKLDPLLKQFVTVRVTSMSNVDKRLFRFDEFQDLDLSWWGTFLSPQGQIYGVYGGKDHISDKTRISAEGLCQTLTRVLNHHYDSRRQDWKIDGPVPDLKAVPTTPKTLPGFKKWYQESHAEVRKQTCLHCHQVNDVLRQERIDNKQFDVKKDFYTWPYPESLGFMVIRDDGLKVKSVRTGSPAALAGLEPKDEIVSAGNRRTFSEADLRGIMHRLPENASEFELRWLRKGVLKSGVLKLHQGWRKSNIYWRKSVAEAHIGSHTGIPWPLAVNKGLRKKLKIGASAMAIKPYWAGNVQRLPAVKAGLKRSDVIIAVNGQRPNLTGRQFNAWFRLTFPEGSKVTYTVINPGNRKQRKITITTQRFGH